MSLTTTHGLKPIATRPVPIKPIKVYSGTEFPVNAPHGAVFLDTLTNACSYYSTRLAEWVPISNVCASESRQMITNCRNCGAPAKGHQCEYCGTRYEV